MRKGRIQNVQKREPFNMAAFTLVEIMIVVAIIGLLCAMAIPLAGIYRTQSQARRILNDCRQMDAAINEWALDTGQADGSTIDTVGASTYMKHAWIVTDLLNNPYALTVVGTTQISINTVTKAALSAVNIDWGSY
jgi:prepilin-type N-terminal cleavage/methylation domain-containing protein